MRQVEIPIRVDCKLSETSTGNWDVVEVYDERDGSTLGDIGVYDFNPFMEFEELIVRKVAQTLREETETFADGECRYRVEVTIYGDGHRIGSATVGVEASPEQPYHLAIGISRTDVEAQDTRETIAMLKRLVSDSSTARAMKENLGLSFESFSADPSDAFEIPEGDLSCSSSIRSFRIGCSSSASLIMVSRFSSSALCQ